MEIKRNVKIVKEEKMNRSRGSKEITYYLARYDEDYNEWIKDEVVMKVEKRFKKIDGKWELIFYKSEKESPIVIDSLLRALCEKGEEITLKANFDV